MSIKFIYSIDNNGKQNQKRKTHMTKIRTFICCLLILLTSFAYFSTTGSEKSLDDNANLRLDINLKAASFDPLFEAPDISPDLRYKDETNYYLVQCNGLIRTEWIKSITDTGAVILGYIPENTYILYMEPESKKSIEELPFIRWIGIYHPAYKLDDELLTKKGTVQLNVLVFNENNDLQNFELVKNKLKNMGGLIFREESEADTIVTELSASKIRELAFIPEVEWLDHYFAPRALMDNIRVFTGAESPLHDSGFNGTGIVGEVKDSGLDQDHPEFEGKLLATDGSVDEDSHGTSTFGIVFAKGVNNRAMGMMPGAQGVFATWGVGRKQSIANLVNNWDGLFQSNSWSSGSMDGSYGSNTRQNDDSVFTYDVTMLYATGNGGNEEAISQEAAAKNVIGVGAFNHYNNKIRTDDRHTGNQGNRGPTADGRVKPDVVGPYDSIYTTTSGDRYTSSFGGTSGATPVAAGAIGLIYEMYRENHFRNNPTKTLPHASTVKAILIADAYQYEFSQGNRFAQGWGLVDVANVYNIGKNHLIDDENNALRTGESITYQITPTTATPLKISLVWTDVPGTVSSSHHLINDLNLKVTDPNGVIYNGNYGLESSKWSTSDGESDDINNVENVFIANPTSGEWTIEVIADSIPMDGHSETPRVDQSYALVASGVTKYEHDLRVQSMGLPDFVGTGEKVPINATILNIGNNEEENVKVELLIDNVTVSTTTINSIDIGEVVETNFIWTPTMPKKYYVSVNVVPISGETSIWDNRKNRFVVASILSGIVLVDDGHGTDSNHQIFYNHIETMGPERYRVHHTTQAITSELLADYDVFMTARPTQSYTSSEIISIEDFVDNGGGVLLIGENDAGIYTDLTSYVGIDWGSPYVIQFDGETNEINPHEITNNVNSLYFDSPQLPLTVSAPAEEIVYTYGGTLYNRVTVAASEYGHGRMVVIADIECLDSQFINQADNKVFGGNIINWLVNAKPRAIITSPLNESEYISTDIIQFDGATSFDPDGITLSYKWSSNIDGELSTLQAFTTKLTAGYHTITLEVVDSGGKSDAVEITLRVFGVPTLDIRSPSGNSILSGTVELLGTAEDIDGTIQNVEVQLDDRPWQNATDTSTIKDWSTWMFSWDTEQSSDGNHTIHVKAMDNDGLNTSIHNLTINIDNTPPQIITGPEVSEISDTEAIISWQTDEPSDGILEYGPDLSYEDTERDTTFKTEHTIELTGLLPKTIYNFKITISDILSNHQTIDSGLSFETELPPDSTPPLVRIISPMAFETLQGRILITTEVSDDYEIAEVEFFIKDKLKFTDVTPDYSWFWDTTSGQYPDGEYSLKITATDLSDNSATDVITVILDNEIIPPSIDLTRVTPNNVPGGEFNEVLFTVQVSDPENRLDTVAIDLSSIGGSSHQKMYDDGRHGDAFAGDNIYSYKAMVYSDTPVGEKSLGVTVNYGEGLTVESTARLLIIEQSSDEVSESSLLDSLLDEYLWLFIIIIALIIALISGAVIAVYTKNKPRKAIEVEPLEVTEYYPPDHYR
jgi:hypothetical protein